jgi:regulator of RNase E activity RraA
VEFLRKVRVLSAQELESIRQFDTCTIANAIEQFGVRLRNEGFAQPGLRCMIPGSARVIGYAATSRVRSADPPATGGSYLDRTDWWEAMERLPAPRIAAIQDVDPEPGRGSAVGEVHSAILKAFKCRGVVTNGAVRDLPAVSRLGFPLFAPLVTVSHSYMHMVDYGQPVEILGLQVRPGICSMPIATASFRSP